MTDPTIADFEKRLDAASLIVTGSLNTKLNDHQTVIGLGGIKECGKDTFADILVRKYGFVKLGMSMGLHEDLMIMNPWMKVGTEPDGHGLGVYDSEGHIIWGAGAFVRYATLHDTVGYVEMKKQYEVRMAQQLRGTETGRAREEDIWANDIAARIHENLVVGPVVVTGMRYENELNMIRSFNGITAYVKRTITSPEQDVYEAKKRATETHSSENSVSEYDFDARILNYGTLDDLEVIADQFYVSILSSAARRETLTKITSPIIPATSITPAWPVYDH